jgi:light-regulated signal transduction histidine kinase (bacteriophytochrome)
MRARGDAGLLRIALTNLLGNAWKFSGGREVTAIDIGQLESDGPMTTFFVRDRGAGFDPAYAEKLFGTFQRLHTQSEFAGTGIGLATVRRVIERHGGSVRAEGAVNQGATFYFSLPGKAGHAKVEDR